MSALFACGDDSVLAIIRAMGTAIARSFIIVALSVSLPIAAAPPAQLILKPTSVWQVDYADERCRLGRQFGDGEQSVILLMDRFGPREHFSLTISGKPVKTFVQKGDAKIQFGPSEQEQPLAFVNGMLGKESALLFSASARIAAPSAAETLAAKAGADSEWVDLQPISEDRKKAVRYLRIGKPLRKSVTLETGSMRNPLAALDTCVENLIASWGVDVEKHKSLTRKTEPLKSPGTWIRTSDYPENMVMAGQPALVSFRLSIGPDGLPTACHIQQTTRPKAFDDAVCKSVMKRARFSPALDAQGQPLASYYQNNVYFTPF